MTDYGIAIAQSGTPINKASDYQRIIDTRWKTMSIVATQRVLVKNAFAKAQVIKILDHNLGYLPAFEAPYYNTRFESQTSQEGAYLFLSDKNSIYLILTEGPGAGFEYTIDGYITVYDLNLEEDYQGADRGLLGSVGKSSRGIKIIGNGEFAARNAGDTDPIGFSITTDSKAIGVDKVGDVTVTGGVAFSILGRGVIKHTLSYPPLVKVSRTFNANAITILNQPIAPPSSATRFCGPMVLPAGARVEPSAIVLESYTVDSYRFVMFKEPTEIAG